MAEFASRFFVLWDQFKEKGEFVGNSIQFCFDYKKIHWDKYMNKYIMSIRVKLRVHITLHAQPGKIVICYLPTPVVLFLYINLLCTSEVYYY